MNSQPRPFPSYPTPYPYAFPQPQRLHQYDYTGQAQQVQPVQQQQNQPFYVQSTPQLQQQQQHVRPTPQPHSQPHNPPPVQQQPQHVPASPSESPNAAPGAPPREPTSPEAELERQLMDALNNDTQQAEQSLAQQYTNQGDEANPIYNMPPPPEHTYPNETAMEKAMHEWCLEHGYELVRRASKKNAAGEQYKRYYDCSRHSRKPSKLAPEERKRKNRRTADTQCPMSVAAVAVDPSNPAGEWQIRHRKTHHNHPAEEGKAMAGHRRRFRDENVLKAVDGLFAIGTSTSQVVQFLQRTSPKGLFTRADVANMKLKWNKYGTCGGPTKEPGEERNVAAFKAAGGACHRCRQKHHACDGTRPTCRNCERSGIECVYNAPRADNGQMDVDGGQSSSQIDLTTQTPPAQQLRPFTASTGMRPRGRPPKATQAPTKELLEDLRAFQKDNFVPERLELRSSSVEVLAQSSCGKGESYKNLPLLGSQSEWQNFKNSVIEASMKENAYDVLMGAQNEPQRPDPAQADLGKPGEIEIWNEYINQLAIYKRRNELLLAALWSRLSHYYRNRVKELNKASEVWNVLEDLFQPQGCETAFKLFQEMHSITLANSQDLKDYIYRLQAAYDNFKQLPLNRTPLPAGNQYLRTQRIRSGGEAVPEEMVCLLFLRNLGQEWSKWAEGLCATNNIGGFGTGERLGLPELCRRAIGYEAMQRRELGR